MRTNVTMLVKHFLMLASILCCLASNAQELAVSKLFADHMVLQRDVPTRFWGSAAPNEIVTISIDGFETNTKANATGKWECLFPAHVAGGPFEVSIKATTEKKIYDVYFGEVWVAGGQSNMVWQVHRNDDNLRAVLADCDYPLIRFFEVPRRVASTPQDQIEGGEWKVANPENIGDFSAVAWFFAKRNHLEKNVPVGVVGSYWGATPAEAWTSIDIIKGIDGYKDEVEKILDPSINWEKVFVDNEALKERKWDLIRNQEDALTLGVHKPGFDDYAWEEVVFPNSNGLSDIVWARKSFSLKTTEGVKLSIGVLPNHARVYINGTEAWNDKMQVLEGLDVSPDLLRKGVNVIAIRAVNSRGNKVQVGKKGAMWIQQGNKKATLEGTWKYSNTVDPAIPKVVNYSQTPSFLYNGMIHPITGYSIKGAIWYQGESNSRQSQYYRDIFGAMIQDWRLKWKQGNFPFLFVQLANYREQKEEPTGAALPGDPDWPRLREAQTQTLELPNTGMAIAIDIGEVKDIHPRNKQDVGKRLWLVARKVVYKEDIVYSGPTYLNHLVNGSQVTITFANTGAGLKIKGEQLKGFALAGEDKKFYWAEGEINGTQIVISSNHVNEPKYIRYAWADNPACNLYNLEDLPAVPFRTDELAD